MLYPGHHGSRNVCNTPTVLTIMINTLVVPENRRQNETLRVTATAVHVPGENVLRAEEPGAEVSVLPSGAGGRIVRRQASRFPEGLEGIQQHRLHGIR